MARTVFKATKATRDGLDGVLDFLEDMIFFGEGRVRNPAPTSKKVVLDYVDEEFGPTVVTVTGRNFSYDFDGLRGGQVEKIVAKVGGTKIGTVTNADIAGGAIRSAVNREEGGDPFAVEKLLEARDWKFVGTGRAEKAGKSEVWGDGRKFDPPGNDVFVLKGGNDEAFGGRGNDVLQGGGGRDRLDGGKGSDRLDGGKGDDELTGGAGRDMFIIKTGTGDDLISDFGPGDKIDVSGHAAVSNFNQIKRKATETAEGLEISLRKDSLMLEGLDLDDIGRGDFVF